MFTLAKKRRRRHIAADLLDNWRHGRMQRSLALATAVAAPSMGFEVYLEHYKASFGDKWMWTPVFLTPPLALAAIGGIFSRRAARTALPILSVIYCLDGVIGMYTHIRGVHRKPGGFSEPTYNLVMGPPLLAPGAFAMIGAFGVLAALMPREV